MTLTIIMALVHYNDQIIIDELTPPYLLVK